MGTAKHISVDDDDDGTLEYAEAFRISEIPFNLRSEDECNKLQNYLRKIYIMFRKKFKEYVVCMPIDHTTSSNTNTLTQIGMVRVFFKDDQPISDDPTKIDYDSKEVYTWPFPMKAHQPHDFTLDGSPVFGGYVFSADMDSFSKHTRLAQFLADEVAKNQFNPET